MFRFIFGIFGHIFEIFTKPKIKNLQSEQLYEARREYIDQERRVHQLHVTYQQARVTLELQYERILRLSAYEKDAQYADAIIPAADGSILDPAMDASIRSFSRSTGPR